MAQNPLKRLQFITVYLGTDERVPLTDTEKIVFFGIYSYCNGLLRTEQDAFIGYSNEKLSEALGVSLRSFCRALSSLEKKGLIRISNPRTPQRQIRLNQAATAHLLGLDEPEQTEPSTREKELEEKIRVLELKLRAKEEQDFSRFDQRFERMERVCGPLFNMKSFPDEMKKEIVNGMSFEYMMFAEEFGSGILYKHFSYVARHMTDPDGIDDIVAYLHAALDDLRYKLKHGIVKW